MNRSKEARVLFDDRVRGRELSVIALAPAPRDRTRPGARGELAEQADIALIE